jgi:hypothetical protein
MSGTDAVAKVLSNWFGQEFNAEAFCADLRDEGYYVAPLTTEGGPTARTTDPRTSHQYSAERMRKNTQTHRLLATFGRWPDDGLTDEQAMERSQGVSASSEFAKRCSDLRAAGLIRDTGRDRKGNSGLDRIVSEITEKGQALLAKLGDPE